MTFLLNHWHCILPVAGLIAAAFLLRGKSDKQSEDKE